MRREEEKKKERERLQVASRFARLPATQRPIAWTAMAAEATKRKLTAQALRERDRQ